MKLGSGEFNKAASRVYATLEEEEKKRLTLVSITEDVDKMRVKDVKKAGGKIFSKIKKLVHNNIM